MGLLVSAYEPHETGQTAACGSQAAGWSPLPYKLWKRNTGFSGLKIIAQVMQGFPNCMNFV